MHSKGFLHVRRRKMRLERVVTRAEKAMSLARYSTEHDFYLDSVALNMLDFYSGLERIFRHIATDVDQSLPVGSERHRDLLLQMSVSIMQLRPHVISKDTVKGLDEYLRFRHIVRNVYAFTFDAERIDLLIRQLRPLFNQLHTELMIFVSFLKQV